MPTDIFYKPFKYQTNGVTYYDILPDYNVSNQLTPTSVSEVQAEINRLSGKTDEWSKNYVQALQQGLSRMNSGYSDYVSEYTHPLSGEVLKMVPRGQVQQIEADISKLRNGELINLGTDQKPLLVPKGTPTPEAANAAFQATQPTPVPQVYYPSTGQLISGYMTNPTTAGQTALYSKAAGYTGPSIVDFLKTAGQPFDHNSLANLAATYGIVSDPSQYRGTATQNTTLLNILKGFAKGDLSANGIPNSITSNAGSVTNPNTPINLSGLSGSAGDLSKILGANVPLSLNGDLAGLLALYGASSDSEKKYEDMQTKLTTLMESLGNEGADFQAELDKQGVTSAYSQIKELNLKAAQLKGDIEKFDVETKNYTDNVLKTQGIPTGLILGQQRQYIDQRETTKAGKLADLSATLALSQAYQGNAQLGFDLAQRAIDIKYAPIKNKLDILKTQLGFAKEKMSKDEEVRSNIISKLISLKENEIEEAKNKEKAIEDLVIQAAMNGAPTSITTQMRGAKDRLSAATIGARYLKGNLEKVGSLGGGNAQGSMTVTRNGKQVTVGVPAANSPFWSKIDSGKNELQQGASWGEVWNRIHMQFPDVANEVIDDALGTQWKEPGAYQKWQTSKNTTSLEDVKSQTKAVFTQYKNSNYTRKQVEDQWKSENNTTTLSPIVKEILDELYGTQKPWWQFW